MNRARTARPYRRGVAVRERMSVANIRLHVSDAQRLRELAQRHRTTPAALCDAAVKAMLLESSS